ncbi:rod shape-determining protein MreD [Wenyingzhuangia sp. IMCC45574]
MNNSVKVTLRVILLILTQVLIGNKMRIFDFVNPQWCILFVLWFPIRAEKALLLITSFFFGLTLDFFSNSGGIYAAAFTLIGFVRLSIFKRILNKKEFFSKQFEYNTYGTNTKILLVFSIALLFHLALFGLEYFNISSYWTVIWKAFVSSIFTTFVSVVVLSIFSPNQ